MNQASRRVASALSIVIGLTLSVGTLAAGLRPALAGERLLNGARGAASAEASERLVADADLIAAGLQAMAAGELPAMRASLGQSETEFGSLLASDFPNVADNLAIIGEGGDSVRKVAANLARLSTDFEQADALPVGFIPLPVAAVGFVGLGLALLVCGVLAWRRTARWPLMLIAAIAFGSASANLITRSPQKAAAAERVIGGVNLADDITDQMQRRFDGASGFLSAYRSELLPAVAIALGADVDDLTARLDTQFPASARLRGVEGVAALRNVEHNITFRRRNVGRFGVVKGLPMDELLWAATALLALLGVSALVAVARTPRSSAGAGHQPESP